MADIDAVQLHGSTLFVAGEDKVYMGADDGASWVASNPVGAAPAPLLAVIPAASGLWVGSYGQGVFHSPDGGATWSGVNGGLTGLGATHITGFALKGDKLYTATDGAGVFELDLTNPAGWTAFNDGLPVSISGTVATIVLHGTTLVAPAGGNGFVYRRAQGVASWQEVAVEPPLLPGFVATDLLSAGAQLVLASGSRLYRSTDDAQSWELADTGLANGTAVFLAHDGAALFAMVNFLDNSHQLYRSDDAGTSWQALEESAYAYVYGLEVAGGNLFAARADGLWWTPLAATPVRPATLGKVKARFRD